MDDGTTYEGADIVAPFGKDVLRRASDGAIVRWTPTGAKTVIVPATCGGRLLHVDAGRQSVVVSCRDLKRYAPPFASSLWLFRAQGGQDLEQHILTRVDLWELTTARGVWIGPFHVDMETAQILPPPPLGPREVHVTRDFQLVATGGFPERGDGMVLRPVGKQSIDVWQGPLRWSR